MLLIILMFLAGCLPPLSPKMENPSSLSGSMRKPLPAGWENKKELLAKWGTSLPTLQALIPDTSIDLNYWETYYSTEKGMRLPIKRATISFSRADPVTIINTDLHFVNVAYIYSMKNYETDHYLLESVVKKVECKPTGFPQLLAGDILRHKILMVYGTPHEYNGIWHRYKDQNTGMSIQEVDDLHLIVKQKSNKMSTHLEKAIRDMYSDEGIEYRKQLMMKNIDL